MGNKEKTVKFIGHNEIEFVQAIGEWLLSYQAIRDKISQAGFDYADIEERGKESS